MIFPTWSQSTINPIDSNSSSDSKSIRSIKKNKSLSKQLEIDFDPTVKVQINTQEDFDKLLKKLIKKIPIFNDTPDLQLTTLDQHYDPLGKIPFPKDIKNSCEYYGIDPQNVVSFTVEQQPGSFIHKITIEKELF